MPSHPPRLDDFNASPVLSTTTISDSSAPKSPLSITGSQRKKKPFTPTEDFNSYDPFSMPLFLSSPLYILLVLLVIALLVLFGWFCSVLWMNWHTLESPQDAFERLLNYWLVKRTNPYTWACLGIASSLGLSTLGAAWFDN